MEPKETSRTKPRLLFLDNIVVDNVICMGMIFVLIPLFRARYDGQGTLLRNLSSSAYHMYLIHAPILVLVSLGFASISLIPVVKLAIVFPLAFILCYLFSHHVLQRIDLNKLTRVALRRRDDG